MAHASFMYKSITKTELQPEVVDPQDYSQTVLAILKEIERSIGMKKVWGSSYSSVQSAHEKMSKDVTNAAGCKSGDFQVVSAGGEEVGADGGDGVGDSAAGEEVGADGRDGVGDSEGGEEVGADGGDGIDESKSRTD